MHDLLARRAALALTLSSVLAGSLAHPAVADSATSAVCRTEARLGKTNREIATLEQRENHLRDDQTDYVLVNGRVNRTIDSDLRKVVADLRRLRSARSSLQKEIARERDTAVADLRVDYTACETAAN